MIHTENALSVPSKKCGVAYALTINYHPDQVDKFEFSDGTVWTASDLRQRYLLQSPTDGDDIITGFYSNDALDGGAGNDALYGGDGSDTYIFGYGHGHDIIEEQWSNVLYSDDDRVVFDAAVLPSDVTFSRIGNTADLLITLVSTGETLTVRGEFYTGNFDMNDVEEFVFADGTVVTEDQLRTFVLTSKAGDETIYGFDKSDTFHYSAGGGNDTFIEGVNSGTQDRIVLGGLLQSDVVIGRDLNDLMITVSPSAGGGTIRLKNSVNDYVDEGIELVEFEDGTIVTRAELRALIVSSSGTPGNDTITGTNSADAIEGGLGNDILDGGSGSDTYYYRRGDGNDTITEAGYFSSAIDRLVLNDIDPADVKVERSGNNLALVIAETTAGAGDGGHVTLNGNGEVSYDSGIESIIFDDGTVWSADDVRTHYFKDIATTGADTILGFNTNDLITGGDGNDVINGGGGADSYFYSRGDGNDSITEAGYFSNAQDRLILDGIDQDDVTFSQSGENLVLNIKESSAGAGDGGSITLVGTGSPQYDSGIELVVFHDDTTWNQNEMRIRFFEDARTSGADTIVGFTTSDTISGGLGDDVLDGGSAGNETYLYARGDGSDRINDLAGTNDRLVFLDIERNDVSFAKSGGNLVISISPSVANGADGGTITVTGMSGDQGVEFIEFAGGEVVSKADLIAELSMVAGTSGNDTLTGTNAEDTITGRAGDDALNGGLGNDTYIYARGDGNDTITEPTDSYSDQIKFTDVNASDVTLSQNGNDLVILVNESSAGSGDGGSIVIKQNLDSYWGRGIDLVKFADGAQWTIAQMRNILLDQQGTSGNNTITGFNTDDTITGRGGNDTLSGLSGNDTFVFGAGFGQDTITDFAAGSGAGDVIRIKDGLFSDFASVMASAVQVGSDTVITYDSLNLITLKNVAVANLNQGDFLFG